MHKPKNICIIDENNYLYESIIGNIWYLDAEIKQSDKVIGEHSLRIESKSSAITISFLSPEKAFELGGYDKIDLLIIKAFAELDEYKYFTHHLLNLTGQPIWEEGIIFPLPLKLESILSLIKEIIESDQLYCKVNDRWIYSERDALLKSATEIIELTEKENQIIRNVITNDFKIDLHNLKQNVWKHHSLCESTTVETHLYRLKKKLPQGFLSFNE